MKQKTIVIHCTYSRSGPTAAELLRESFRLFLKQELLGPAIRTPR